jgi:hypothetical protein
VTPQPSAVGSPYGEAFKYGNQLIIPNDGDDRILTCVELSCVRAAKDADPGLARRAGRIREIVGGGGYLAGMDFVTEATRRIAHAYVDSLERRDWPGVTELLAEDVTYDMPQSRERILGRPDFLRFNVEYPGDWHLTVRRIVADGRSAALWIDARVGDEPQTACVWLGLSEQGLIERITDYWPEPSEPLPGREHLVTRY